jgi:hypothetical protein
MWALAAGSASAATIHVPTQTITGTGTFALNNPNGVAIDNSGGSSAGSIYVSDTGNHRIMKFDSAGNFLLMWGREVNEGSGDPNICTNAGPPTDICKLGEGGNGPGWVSQPNGIAVDPSSGPSAGDVYVVADIGNAPYVEKFDPTGHLITSWGGSPFAGALDGSTAPGGPFEYFFGGITVDLDGNFEVFKPSGTRLFKFAQDGSSPSSVTTVRGSSQGGLSVDPAGNFFKINGDQSTVEKFGPTGADLGQVNVGTGSSTSTAYDTVDEDLFIRGSDGVNLFHFNGSGQVVQSDASTCAPEPFVGCGATENFGSEDLTSFGQGIAVSSTSHKVYVANSGANNVKVFSLLDVPGVTTGAVSNLARDSVSFNGHVDPEGGGEVTSCHFEWGLTTSYGSTAPCNPATTSAATDVSSELPPETLASATTYHYRLVAANGNGGHAGKDQTFTTPVAVGGVTTEAASNIEKLSATINGSFVGDGVDTSYHFEYGPTTSYGQTTPDVDQGSGTGVQEISANLTGLFSYSTYHYRLVAHNKYGTTIGGDQAFLTAAPDAPIVERTFSSGVTDRSATIDADIDTGSGLTVFRFDYGTDAAYGSRTLVAGPIEPGSPENTASAELFELEPGTTYHFRILATNLAGTTVGPDQTFRTQSAPVVDAESASAVTAGTATVSAAINPGLSSTTFHVEYGPTAGYGLHTGESAPIGSNGSAQTVSSELSGLAAGATYHFRIVASNAIGTTYGTDETFTTQSPAQVVAPVQPLQCKKGFVKKHGKCVRKKPKAKRKKKGHG